MSERRQYLPDIEEGLRFFPEQASRFATELDTFYLVLVVICGVMTLLVFGLILYFGYRYRAASQADRGNFPGLKTSHRVEFGVLGIMFIVFMGIFLWSSGLYLEQYRGPQAAMTLNVVGKQWMWKVQHPSGAREINTLHIPVGETIALRVTSEDVIHSVYIPDFRIKRDVLPGAYYKVWFEATKPGEYRLFCAEYCGSYHSRMRGKVVAMDKADYQRWLSRQGEHEAPEVEGARLFESYGCSGCHMDDSSDRAPHLAGLFGRPVALEEGGTILADDAYLRDSILQPQKHVVAGFEPIMPSFSGQISEDELLQIIAYIKSLDPEDSGQPSAGTNAGDAP